MQDFWTQLFEIALLPVDDAGSRLFHLNILASVALIAIWYALVRPQNRPNIRFQDLLLKKRYWWNRSTRVDYQVYVINVLLKATWLAPLTAMSFAIAVFMAEFATQHIGPSPEISPSGVALWVFTLMSFVTDDFLRFFHHWLMHKVPWLWPFHITHHSARVLTPITLYRTHPIEVAIATLRNSLSLGVSLGAFVWIFQGSFSLITLFGVNWFGMMFNLLGANLRHSQIPMSFGPLEKIFISPLQHQIHHSRDSRHYDSNYGVSLAIWDQIWGSWKSSSEATGRLSFGVPGVSPSRLSELMLGRNFSQRSRGILNQFSSRFQRLLK
jgi:sterol desaturase/sphingolipid hydroxylase (fatty acid hydroxylase superfamily)